jgi:pimeloyl-ACP methyl ester carboxylesterase
VLRLTICLCFIALQLEAATSGTDPVRHGLEPGRYAVGFKLLEEQDRSRAITGGNLPPRAHPRPMRIYLWYPVRSADDAQPMQFGRYSALADEDIWPAEIAGTLRQELKYSRRVLARSLIREDYDSLLKRSVIAIENADALKGPFPLIVMAQGLYYESPIAFAAMGEYLAGRGFVVATCPLVGTNSPIVRMDPKDLETQVRDLEFAIAHARALPFVSQDMLGVFGFDMGGMASLILAMRNADVDAFVSVSSGILYPHPSGLPAASPHHDPLAMRAPWLHSMPASWMKQPSDSDAKSLYDTAIHSERYLLLTDGMGHVDYTSYALIPGRKAMGGYWEASSPGVVARHMAVSQYVSHFFAAYLQDDSAGQAFLSKDPGEAVPGSTMALEHRAAAPESITYEKFVLAVLAGRAEDAIDEVREMRESQPDHILLNETGLERLVWSLRDTWGLTNKIMPVIRFRAELYPGSNGAQRMLAEGLTTVGDYPAAIEVYTRLLEQNPDNGYIKSRLDWLQSQ